MRERQGKKRSKSYYMKCAHGAKKRKLNDLDAGMKGFLVTCNKYEMETVREMYNILNEYADKVLGPETLPSKKDETEDGSDEEDLEKAMAKEAAELKQVASVSNTERRFQNTDTKSKNCIFIRTTLDDPAKITHDIFTEIVEKQEQKARYALRMVPVQVTCKANMESIKQTAETLLKSYFETDFGVGLKFEAVCKIRNNEKMSRHQIFPMLGRIVQEMNPLHTFTHDEPDLVIIVEVIRNVFCLSVVKDYHTFRRFNLHEVLKNKDAEQGKEEKVGAICEAAEKLETNLDKDVEEAKAANIAKEEIEAGYKAEEEAKAANNADVATAANNADVAKSANNADVAKAANKAEEETKAVNKAEEETQTANTAKEGAEGANTDAVEESKDAVGLSKENNVGVSVSENSEVLVPEQEPTEIVNDKSVKLTVTE